MKNRVADLRAPLRDLVTDACEALIDAADEVTSIVLYGSAARDEWDDATSDVNLLVELPNATLSTLESIGGPIRRQWRRHRVLPFLAAQGELAQLADVFPLEVLDIQRCHIVVHGPDPLAGIDVDREHLRLKVEQELRLHLRRTRFRMIQAAGDRNQMISVLEPLGPALRADLFGLLEIHGERLENVKTERVFAAAAQRFDLDHRILQGLAAVASGSLPRDVDGLAGSTLALLENAVAIADGA